MRAPLRAMAALACLFALPVPVGAAERVVGIPRIIDGDTMEVRGRLIGLLGIDAPEARQMCTDETGRTYRCGYNAAVSLASKIGRRAVECIGEDTDRLGRLVALCRVRREDVGRWMVAQGLALALRPSGQDYVADEEVAKNEKRGLWRGAFETPWEWRKHH